MSSFTQSAEAGGLVCCDCQQARCAIFPDGRGSCCFDFEAYRRAPLVSVRNGDVDRKKMLAKKREYARRRKERKRSMGLTGKGKPRKAAA